ncbi:major facilitator superfamily domain-containing protein [Xylaria longipes]|nr:major facilitator superfamily domain-containing protein [Xylaria longipes]
MTYIVLGINGGSQRPRNWHRTKKWTATLIVSAFAFLQPLSETMLAPAEKQISNTLRITRSYRLLVNSLNLIGVWLSLLVLAPLSEVYGRKPVLIVASIFIIIIWNTACGASTTLSHILAFHLLSGFGASIADALAGGFMSDLWGFEERGRAFAIYMAVPLGCSWSKSTCAVKLMFIFKLLLLFFPTCYSL